LPDLDAEKTVFSQHLDIVTKGLYSIDLVAILVDKEDTTHKWAAQVSFAINLLSLEYKEWTVSTVKAALDSFIQFQNQWVKVERIIS
jgi:hypothetical protein